MKKKIICIFVCMLLIAVSISSVTGTIDKNESLNMKNDDYNNLIKQVIESGIISNNDWLEQDKLLASDGASLDWFGFSVSIDGDYAIVGARGDDDNGGGSGSAYVFIYTETPPIPDLDCSGSLIWSNLKPGMMVTGEFEVENSGDPDSLLDWEIESYPDWGTWIFDPENGTDLLAGETSTIDVEVVAPDEQEETFTGEIVLVNSNDPDDTCIIDVSLATPVNQQVDMHPLFQRILERFPNSFPLLRQLLGL